MRVISTCLLALAATAALASAAFASGLAPMAPMQNVYYNNTSVANWDGLYAGGYIGASSASAGALSAGGIIGYNFTSDNILFGAELQAGARFSSSSALEFQAVGHAGVPIANDVALYGLLGVGYIGTPEVSFGAGVQFAIDNDMSLRGEASVLSSGGVRATAALLFKLN